MARLAPAELSGPYRFAVRYDDDAVRDAVRAFVRRRAVTEQTMMWVVSVLMGVFCVYLLIVGETGILAGILLALALAPFAFVAVLWRAHHVNTWGRYKRMADKAAALVVDTDGFEVTSDLGHGRVAWRNVTEVWERPRSFMLFSGPASFNIVPRDGMPTEVQAYLSALAASGRANDP